MTEHPDGVTADFPTDPPATQATEYATALFATAGALAKTPEATGEQVEERAARPRLPSFRRRPYRELPSTNLVNEAFGIFGDALETDRVESENLFHDWQSLILTWSGTNRDMPSAKIAAAILNATRGRDFIQFGTEERSALREATYALRAPQHAEMNVSRVYDKFEQLGMLRSTFDGFDEDPDELLKQLEELAYETSE